MWLPIYQKCSNCGRVYYENEFEEVCTCGCEDLLDAEKCYDCAEIKDIHEFYDAEMPICNRCANVLATKENLKEFVLLQGIWYEFLEFLIESKVGD